MAVRSVLVKLLGDPSQLDRTLDDEKVKLDAFTKDRTVRIMADPSDIATTFGKLGAALVALNQQAQGLRLSIDDTQAQGALDRALVKALALRKLLGGMSMDVSGRGLMTGPQDVRVIESRIIGDAIAKALPAPAGGGISENQKAVISASLEAITSQVLERGLGRISLGGARAAGHSFTDFFDRLFGGPEGRQPGKGFSFRKAISDWFHTPGFSVVPSGTGVFDKPGAGGGGPFGTLFSLLGNVPFVGPLIGNPAGLVASLVALAALGPGLGTVIGGGIVGGLGTGLLGFGLAHSLQQSPFLTDKQNDLRARVSAELRRIHTTFNAGVIRDAQTFTGNFRSIGHVFGGDVVPITQALGGAFNFMSPGFRDLGRSLGFALGGPPAPPRILPRGLVSAREVGNVGAKELQPGTFESAITSIGHAFGMFEKIFAPQIPGIVNAIAGGIKKLTEAFIQHPEVLHVMAAMLAFFLKLPGYVLDGLAWLVDKFGTQITKMRQAAHDIHAAWDVARHETAVIFDGWRHDISKWFDGVRHDAIEFGHGWEVVWDSLWQSTIGNAIRSMRQDSHDIDNWRHDISSTFDKLRHDVSAIWDMLWHDTISFGQAQIRHVENDVDNWRHNIEHAWDTLRHDVASIWNSLWRDTVSTGEREIRTVWNGIWGEIRHWPQWFWNTARSMVEGLVNGARSDLHAVTGFFAGLGHDILHAFGSLFHFGSPSKTMFQYGQWIIHGLADGINAKMPHLSGTIKAMGSSVSGWIAQALAITHKPMSWLPALLRLVSLESGGNPRAYNPISVGGEHATGLFQTLPSTFAAYSLGGSIFNPVADAIAGIRYLSQRYGSPFNIPGLFDGRYMGYASGGWIHEPIIGRGLMSGSRYAFGERGPEYISPGGGHGGNTYNISVQVQGGTHPADVGRQIVYYIRKFEQRSGTSWRH